MSVCAGCGGPVRIAASSGRPFKYCSDNCRGLGRRLLPTVRQCAICGEEFVPRSANNICCSDECSAERRRRRNTTAVRADGHCHRRRSEKFGCEYEAIDPYQIFARDKWMCQICLAPVDQDVTFPHPLAATLDHIVPLSRGGNHEVANVRTSHWCCNRAKHGRLDEEIQWPEVDHQRQQLS